MQVVQLSRGGTSLVLGLPEDDVPVVLHWGPDLGSLTDSDLTDLVTAVSMPFVDSAVMSQERLSLLPRHSSGWIGRPGIAGSRSGSAWSLTYDGGVDHAVEEATDVASVRSTATDTAGGLEVVTEVELLGSGLVRVRAGVRNLGADGYEVLAVEPALPVPAEADEVLDTAGRHTHEREPQRRPFDLGQWVREARGGRPGHESPLLLCAGRAGFGFRTGRVWGVHLAWSGNQVLSAERSFTGWRLLRGGELLLPGEVRLAHGESYQAPWLYGSWGEGLDQLSARFHDTLRARPDHPRAPRKVVFNTWEPLGFDLSMERLLDLADRAAAVGAERYVLDDGWFRGRRDDRAGLGDWYVDEEVFPDGLRPLVDRVHELGMDFGLWFEPEAVNQDSDLARAHPDWLFQTEHGPGVSSRFQHVLDLGNPAAYDFVLERMSAVIGELDVAFVKWDHNRALVDAGHAPAFTPGVRAQTEAAYRLMSELKARHPGLEIESCCGGGGRLDLGVMEHTDRVWVSDCIDAHERHRMVRWTGLTLPPEVLGTHIGATRDHTTSRTHALSFRAGTALWGHLGIEWDIRSLTDLELVDLRRWVGFHKEVRDLLHSGRVVRADSTNPALSLDGVVAVDGGDALFRLSALEHTLTWPPGRVTLPGLMPDARYHVRLQPPGDGVGHAAWAPPWVVDGVVQTGQQLGEVGLQSPLLDVDHLVLLRASRV